MKAAQRRVIADRLAVLAVDQIEGLNNTLAVGVFPEELLDLQHRIEDLFYVELAAVKP